MRVRVTASEGYENASGIDARPGDIIDVDETLARKLIARHVAVPAPAPEPVIETAEKTPPRNTAKRVSKPRTRTRK